MTEVHVLGEQFKWNFRYPGTKKKFNADYDLTNLSYLHVPFGSGNKTLLHLRSKDVIHSVFIPAARFKQDAVPGREILQWVEVTKPGKYEIPCAELCGFGHSGMKGYLFVHTPEAYQQWLKEKWPS